MDEKNTLFKRKIEYEIANWQKSLSLKKKALVIKGLRQIGKTSIVKKYAYEHYENVIYIDFKKELRLKKIFEEDLSVNSILQNLSAYKPGIVFIPYKTVLIFDEIQECSGARASIKYFMEDGQYDVIATGSLLGIEGYNNKYTGGVPVGFEHIVHMKSMDFEEFLWAKGISYDITNYLSECYQNKAEIKETIHNEMFKLFKEYLCVGGMPAVVNTFIKTYNYNVVRQEQKDILESYKDDFGKYINKKGEEDIDKTMLARITNVFENIPSQLAKENKKFAYSYIEHKGTSAKYDPAIRWLVEYGVINYCYNLRCLEDPLEGNKIDNIFKLYVSDSGLFISMLDDDTIPQILSDNLNIYKGAIYENIIADALSKNNKKLYYYSKNTLEIDFIIKHNNVISLVEVKARNGNAKSAKTIINNKEKYPEVNKIIKLGIFNIKQNNQILNIPLYLAYLL